MSTAAFTPQVEATPFDFDDTQEVAPVPDLYRPDAKSVHLMPSDYFNGRTYALATGEQQRVKDKQETGTGCRVTIMVLPGGGAVSIASSPEPISGSTVTTVTAAGAHYPMGFTLPAAAATGATTIFQMETRDEVWITAIAASAVSVMVEGYYGS
jgi:hypothetical protein